MVFYFIILFYWLILLVTDKSQKMTRGKLFFAILPLYLIMALKSVSVGCDTISYYNRYIGAADMFTVEIAITEQGYNWLSYFFHDILDVPFYVYYAAVSLIICFVLALFIKHFSTNIYLSLYFYMTIGLFTMSMSGLRQMLAISICMLPVIWAKKREDNGIENRKHKVWRLIVSVLLVFWAYSFHNSAIIFLPILFLLQLRLSRRQTIIIMVIGIAASLLLRNALVSFMGNFVTEKYEKYSLTGSYAMNTLMLLVPIAIGLFCVFISRPKDGERVYSKALSSMFIFLTLVVMFNNLALSNNQIARLGYYFMESYIILIPFALKKLPTNIRSVVTAAVILLCFVFFYLGTDGGTLEIDNYKFFWQEPIYLNN